MSVAYLQDEKLFWVSSGTYGENKIYNLQTYEPVQKWTNFSATCTAFDSKYYQYAEGDKNGAVYLLDVSNPQQQQPKKIWSFAMFQGSCTQVCFNRVGDLATSGADGQIKIKKKGETSGSQRLQAISSVDHLTWSQDDQLIIAVTKQSLEIWDRSNRKLVNYKTNRRIAGVHMDEKHEGTLIMVVVAVVFKNGEADSSMKV